MEFMNINDISKQSLDIILIGILKKDAYSKKIRSIKEAVQ